MEDMEEIGGKEGRWVCVKEVGTRGGRKDEGVYRWVDREVFKAKLRSMSG